MSQELSNIEAVLRVYLERGRKAMEDLGAGEVDSAIRFLSMRRAAYYNYLALDYKAKQDYPDYEEREPFPEIWSEIDDSNENLERVIRRYSTKLQRQLGTLRESRNKLNKFKSLGEKSKSFQSEA